MDRRKYAVLAVHVGRWLRQPMPRAVPVDEIAHISASTAVYVVDDALERTVYVGSVHRPDESGAVNLRFQEHLRDPVKRLVWHSVWILPLMSDTPVNVVRRIEGIVGVGLKPRLNRRLPTIFG